MPVGATHPPVADSTGPQTPCDGVAAIPLLSETEGSDRRPQTIAHKSFGGWDDILVERLAVALRRRFVGPNSCSSDTRESEPRGVRPTKAIERQLHRAMYSLQEHRGLFHPQPAETPPIEKNYQTNPFLMCRWESLCYGYGVVVCAHRSRSCSDHPQTSLGVPPGATRGYFTSRLSASAKIVILSGVEG
jgi:hypothetical protein